MTDWYAFPRLYEFDREVALNLWADGTQYKDIVPQLPGATYSSVKKCVENARRKGDPRAKFHAHGKRGNWLPESCAKLTEMWLASEPAALIAEVLNKLFPHMAVTRFAVIGKAHRLGLPPHRSPNGASAFRKARHVRGVRAGSGRDGGLGSVLARIQREPPKPSKTKPVVEPPRPPQVRMLSLLELTASDCHFPIGDPKQPGFAYCGAPITCGDGRSYCDHHHQLCYVAKSSQLERRRARDREKRAIYWLGAREVPFG